MGRLLAALIADSETVPAANPAKVANIASAPVQRFADSQDSQGVELPSAKDQTARLLAELRRQFLPDDWIGLDHGDIADMAALTDRQLSAYVRMLADADLRRRGKVPADETAPALCKGCGPVWVHPAVAAVAPMVDGWPRVLGCPWCHVKNRALIPRPPVACGSCAHFPRDRVNPPGGMGRCGLGRAIRPGEPLHYPRAQRQCVRFEPSP